MYRSTDPVYLALSPRAPAYVHAPSIALLAAVSEPTRSEQLRRQIVAAQQIGERSPYRR